MNLENMNPEVRGMLITLIVVFIGLVVITIFYVCNSGNKKTNNPEQQKERKNS